MYTEPEKANNIISGNSGVRVSIRKADSLKGGLSSDDDYRSEISQEVGRPTYANAYSGKTNEYYYYTRNQSSNNGSISNSPQSQKQNAYTPPNYYYSKPPITSNYSTYLNQNKTSNPSSYVPLPNQKSESMTESRTSLSPSPSVSSTSFLTSSPSPSCSSSPYLPKVEIKTEVKVHQPITVSSEYYSVIDNKLNMDIKKLEDMDRKLVVIGGKYTDAANSAKVSGGNYVRVWDIKERYKEVDKIKEKEKEKEK